MRRSVLIGLLFVFIFTASLCHAQCYGIKLVWDGVPDVDLAGYRVFMRLEGSAYDYSNPAKELDQDTNIAIISNLPNGSYAFVVRAYDLYGNESDDSNEVGPILLSSFYDLITTPPQSPGGCIIIDVYETNCL